MATCIVRGGLKIAQLVGPKVFRHLHYNYEVQNHRRYKDVGGHLTRMLEKIIIGLGPET